jgi:hypothetical protein
MAIAFTPKQEASPNKTEPVSPNKPKDWKRNAKWRAANPDAYRAYMAEYMRKRRKG